MNYNRMALVALLMQTSIAFAQVSPVRVASHLTMQVVPRGRELLRDAASGTLGEDGKQFQPKVRAWSIKDLDRSWITKGYEHPSGRFLFYSNRPETIVEGDPASDSSLCNISNCLVDGPSPHVLFRGEVVGLGQVFSWHANDTATNMFHGILVRNVNDFPIHVSSVAWAAMDDTQDDNNAAWRRYAKAPVVSATLAPGKQAIYFRHNVPAQGNAFGIVAEVEVTREEDKHTTARAEMTDIVWANDSDASLLSRDYASMPVVKSGGWERGVGDYYALSLRIESGFDAASTEYQAYRVGLLHCHSGGGLEDDGTGIPLRSPDGDGYVGALYGRGIHVRWPLVNRSTSVARMRVAIGNGCGPNDGLIGYTIRYVSGRVASVDNVAGTAGAGNYVDVLEADVPPGGVWEPEFDLYPAAPRVLPLTIGAYVVK